MCREVVWKGGGGAVPSTRSEICEQGSAWTYPTVLAGGVIRREPGAIYLKRGYLGNHVVRQSKVQDVKAARSVLSPSEASR